MSKITNFLALCVIFFGIAAFAVLAAPFVLASWVLCRNDERRKRSTTPRMYP